jgi:hypothetical protein
MKRRLIPDTVFGRLISALLAVIGVAVLVIVVLIVRERRDLKFWGGEAAASPTCRRQHLARGARRRRALSSSRGRAANRSRSRAAATCGRPFDRDHPSRP